MAKKTSSIMDDIQQYIGTVQPTSAATVAAAVAIVPQLNHDKISMDMKILQNRIDSVSIIQYYRDLKNERIRTGNTQAIYMQDESKLKDDIDRMMDAKPWVRLDTFTKRKKITQFIETLVSTGVVPIESKKSVGDELLVMLENKKINNKNMVLNAENNIIKLGSYSLALSIIVVPTEPMPEHELEPIPEPIVAKPWSKLTLPIKRIKITQFVSLLLANNVIPIEKKHAVTVELLELLTTKKMNNAILDVNQDLVQFGLYRISV
jgi:hypothetical protein